MLIAHRGIHGRGVKENSILSFENAINSSRVAGFECDIRMTKDHNYVINHDAFYKGNIIKKKNINDLDLPSLDDVLKLDTNKIILIEIKDKDSDIESLLSIIKKYPGRNIWFMSYYKEVLAKLLKKDKNYKVGLLNFIINSEISYFEYDFVCLLKPFKIDNIITYFLNKKIDLVYCGYFKNDFIDSKEYYNIIDISSI